MKTLMIKDLSASVELDSKAMASVAGGTFGRVRRLPYWGAPSLSVSLTDIDTKSVIASQDLAQVMNVDTAPASTPRLRITCRATSPRRSSAPTTSLLANPGTVEVIDLHRL